MKNDTIRELVFQTILLGRNRCDEVQMPCVSVLSSLIQSARAQLHDEPTCISLAGRFVVVGDIHGDIDTLIRIFERCGYPPKSSYLFLGDYVDRGQYSLEVMILLISLKLLYPTSIYLLRGNHETRNISKSYGFCHECNTKANFKIYQEFCSLFDELPLVAILNQRIYCAHGGISGEAMDMCDVILLQKPIEKPQKNSIVTDILWSDPSDLTDEFEESERGCGHVFGEKALDAFLSQNGFTSMIRGHQTCNDGYDKPFENDKCWTVFSSADYCENWNTAAVLIVEDDKVVEIELFDPCTVEEKREHTVILPSWLLELEEPAPIPIDTSMILTDEFFLNDLNLLITNESL
ncbi:Serine/threonine-protein phosphatase PP1 isozyme 8 [Tritrichomonas foetus]|uniref:Serine/threonine-protein phosphatase n=1 Tax=Tritrichomonas foetus TaxID=1144522 RepID=A0A1J4KGG0_9EUKA|nr:Serine/threonine-protein phosphatase PP1 isozyme 8 [Tritrichomonas foetus]|eukprot:OHT10024.1 Serine/threonine-protein phosphatase PP1 isozyme 8 [Tritrichomonas foetus]